MATSYEVLSNLQATAPQSFFSDGTEPTTPKELKMDITCTICMTLLDRPMELSCGNLVCLICLTKWVNVNNTVSCPCCYSDVHILEHSHTPSKVTMTILGSQLVECSKGCNKIVRVDEFTEHARSGCREHFQYCICSPSRTTLKHILERHDAPTLTEQRVASNLLQRMLSEQEDGVIQIPTSGQVIKIHGS